VLVLVFLLWSVLTSYYGATSVFVLRPWAARLWFLILPAIVYSFALVVVIASLLVLSGFLSGTSVAGAAPDLAHSGIRDTPAYSVRYPGNWQCEIDPSGEAEDSVLDISGPGVSINIWLGPRNAESFPDAARALMNLMASDGTVLGSEAVDRWGDYAGAGQRFQLDAEGTRLTCVAFVGAFDSRQLHVTECCEQAEYERQMPGMDLIRRTYRLKQTSSTSAPP
jgi:hypothetical protein